MSKFHGTPYLYMGPDSFTHIRISKYLSPLRVNVYKNNMLNWNPILHVLISDTKGVFNLAACRWECWLGTG